MASFALIAFALRGKHYYYLLLVITALVMKAEDYFSEYLGGTGTVAQNLHDLLTGKMLKLTKPNIIFFLVAVATILTVLVITLVVRARQGGLNSSTGKFTNPLKNINVIMAIVWLVFICLDFILDTLVHLGITLPYLLFLNFPQGKHRVAGLSCKKQ